MNKLEVGFFIGIFSMATNAFCGQLVIMRHGESVKNVLGIHNGSIENNIYPLTQRGRDQAEAAGIALAEQGIGKKTPVVRVYVSPMLRALETADVIMEKLGISADKRIIDPRLIEEQYGQLEGRKISDDPVPLVLEEHGGESEKAVFERANAFLKSLEVEQDRALGTVIVVTHGSPGEDLVNIAGGVKRPMLQTAEFKIFSD